MELGPIQELWIKQLKQHPERQTTRQLGEGKPDDYKACCLGELLLCKHRIEHKSLPFYDDKIFDGQSYSEYDDVTLTFSYEELGLRDRNGKAKNIFKINGHEFQNLAIANDDSGVSWLDIAKVVEENPENFFIKSV